MTIEQHFTTVWRLAPSPRLANAATSRVLSPGLRGLAQRPGVSPPTLHRGVLRVRCLKSLLSELRPLGSLSSMPLPECRCKSCTLSGADGRVDASQLQMLNA